MARNMPAPIGPRELSGYINTEFDLYRDDELCLQGQLSRSPDGIYRLDGPAGSEVLQEGDSLKARDWPRMRPLVMTDTESED